VTPSIPLKTPCGPNTWDPIDWSKSWRRFVHKRVKCAEFARDRGLITAELELGARHEQSELIEKVAQATELNQAAAGQAVKAVVNAVLDALLAGEAVRVSGLGIFNVAARPARQGRNPQTGETIQIAATKAVRFHAGKAVKDALNPPTPKGARRKKTAPPKKSAVRK
jgi:DNA-binding protein HU-beta